jgi:predicted TIM-barrel fold metal-dependent hydrolase
MIVDCHVNIWEERHLTPLFAEQMARIRPGGMGLKADADTLCAAMQGVDRAIVFALRYGDSAGVESDDETTAAAVAKYPDKFVGFAYADPRRPDCMELLRHATRDLACAA